MNKAMDDVEVMEWEFISRITLNPATIDAVGELVNGTHFADKDRGMIFEGLSIMRNGGGEMSDIKVVGMKLSNDGCIDSVGGTVGFVRKVLEHTGEASVASSIFYANEIVRSWRLRRIRSIANEMLDDSANPGANPTDIAERCSMQIEQASAPEEKFQGAMLSEAIMECADMMEAQIEKGDMTNAGYKTGMDTVDEMTGGFMPGELAILAARTSVGKTACAVGWAIHGVMQDRPSLVISMEMRQYQLAQRIIAREIGLSAVDLRSGAFTLDDVKAVRDLGNQTDGLKLGLYNMRGATVPQIASLARRWKYEHGLAAIFIDYLQLIEPTNTKVNRAEQVSKISGDLLTAADKLDVPVIALSQLNRAGQESGKPDPPPLLSNLRESGSIEQDAEVVMMLHRQRDQEDATLYMRKLRQGSLGEIELAYNGPRFTFTER
ncbi:MAG: DnaB-like helicase C-terminal domain-containing protein [Planctomycetota bacterium]